jgi:hypothetical protein
MTAPDPMNLTSLSDDELLAELRRVAEDADPVPPSMLDTARALFELRSLDVELLGLLSDSLVDADPERTRAPERTATPGTREVTFVGADGSVEVGLSVQATGDRRHVTGQLVDARLAAVGPVLRVHSSEGEKEVPVDGSGLFAARDLPSGPVRLEFTGPGRRLVLAIAL